MDQPEVRVGDAERRVVDDRLMAAVGDGVLTLVEYDERAGRLWESRTRGELQALVADLPSAPAPARPVALTASAAPARRVVAVLSEDRFSGVVAPGQSVGGYAVLGKAVVDLRREDLPDGVRVRVRAVLGEVEVQLPPGSRVELSGVSVLGDRSVGVAAGAGPLVHLDAVALLGSVRVTVGDGSVTPAEHRDGHPAVASWPMAPPGSAVRPRQPVWRRLAQQVRSVGLTGLLVLGAGGVVASGTDERVVFGSGVERVTETDTEVAVSLLFGSVQVVVPDGVRVETTGLLVFGSTDCATACSGSGERVVTVRRIGGFGSVEVVTQSEYEADRRD